MENSPWFLVWILWVNLLQNFYLIGRDESKSFRRILKIDRTERSELILYEDPTRYTNAQMRDLKRWISRGNAKHGGLKAVTTCYGIIGTSLLFYPPMSLLLTYCFVGLMEQCWFFWFFLGFVRFLEPYYMLVITKRKKVGEICGHTIYGIAESLMIVIPNPSVSTGVADCLDERR